MADYCSFKNIIFFSGYGNSTYGKDLVPVMSKLSKKTKSKFKKCFLILKNLNCQIDIACLNFILISKHTT